MTGFIVIAQHNNGDLVLPNLPRWIHATREDAERTADQLTLSATVTIVEVYA